MKSIKIISLKIVTHFLTDGNVIRYVDKDGNRYYRKVDSEKITCIPSEENINNNGYKEGYGLSLEEAYCNMNKSFNIPDRLTT